VPKHESDQAQFEVEVPQKMGLTTQLSMLYQLYFLLMVLSIANGAGVSIGSGQRKDLVQYSSHLIYYVGRNK
jgi:hypothetical protein